MAKGKQKKEGHKTKLTLGRTLPKGRNVTNTSFKAKKIVVQSRSHKEKAELTIKDYIQKVHVGNVNVRASTLEHLNAAIKNEKNNLFLYLPEILETVTKNIFENETQLVNSTMTVLETVFEFTNDLQISSFVPLLRNIISCAMTNLDIKIKQNSLKLLNKLLTTHPNLFCNSMTILNDLKSLLSTPAPASSRKGKKTAKALPKSCLAVGYGNSIYSQEWRMQVLSEMNLFLQMMLENNFKKVNDNDRDQQEVRWDCKSPLYVEIFAGGGLKPVDIERLDAWNFNSKHNDIEDPVKVQIFLSDIVNLLSIIFVEEISEESSVADDHLLSPETIGNLCILFKLLSHAGEWVKLLHNYDNDLKMFFIKELNEKFFKRMEKFPFIARGPVFDSKSKFSTQLLSCVQLNLSVCYLYSEFLLNTDSGIDSLKSQVFQYLKSPALTIYEVRYDSIPVFIKLVKIYVNLINSSTDKSKVVIKPEFVSELICYMSQNFKGKTDNPNRKLLFEFFIYLSLKPGHNYLTETRALKEWFVYLLNFLDEMCENAEVDKKILKDIRKIATRRHPMFLNMLQKYDTDIIRDLLLNENEDVSETAVFLIYNMRTISPKVFDMCSGIILNEPTFSTRSFYMLIRLLTQRFTEPGVSAEDRVNFIAFLLNTAIDSSSIYNDKWAEFDLPEFSEAYLPCKNVTSFNIIPSLHWKEHEKIYEVCVKSLNEFSMKTINLIMMEVYKDIGDSKSRNLPIHSAIALLRLMNPDETNVLYSCQKQDLAHSCLMFLSVFTTVVGFNEWYRWNVGELMKCLDFERKFLVNVIEQLGYDTQAVKEGIVVYYLLRILKLLVAQNFVVLAEDADKVIKILNNIKKNCVDENLLKQPLYLRLLNYVSYF